MSSTTIVVNSAGNFVRDGVVQASGPLTVTNAGPGVLTVLFDCQGNTISNANNYIILNSADILFDGKMIPVNINATSYPGLIKKDNVNYSNVTVQNVVINVTGGQMNLSAGWVCHEYTKNITILYCSSNGPIQQSGGGIVGFNCGGVTCINCSSSGTIGTNAGGIFGARANEFENAPSLNTSAINCYSTGNFVGPSGGGIFGQFANINCVDFTTKCEAIGCYSTGNMSTQTDCGGIFGSHANRLTFATCNASNCYSVGFIGTQCGGIFGPFAGAQSSDGGCIAEFCYSSGKIGLDNPALNSFAGGIFSNGSNFAANTAQMCYARGALGTSNGNGAIVPTTTPLITVTSCYNATSGWVEGTASTTLSLGSNPTVWVSVDNNSPYLLDYYRTSWGNPFPPNPSSNFSTFTTNNTTYDLAGFFSTPPSFPPYPNTARIYNYMFLNKTNLFTGAPGLTGMTGSFNGFYLNMNGQFYSGPLKIQNSDPMFNQPLTINFNAARNINTFTNNYFILDTDKIEFNGQNIPITINIANYPGLLRKTDAFSNIVIQNVGVNTLSSGSLVAGNGWIGGQTGWNGGSFINCTSNGAVPVNGGGIVGSMASNVTCINCFQNGSLTTGSGFIFGSNGGNNNNTVACFVNGSGPLVGASSDEIGVRTCFRYGLTPEGFSTYNLIFDP